MEYENIIITFILSNMFPFTAKFETKMNYLRCAKETMLFMSGPTENYQFDQILSILFLSNIIKINSR